MLLGMTYSPHHQFVDFFLAQLELQTFFSPKKWVWMCLRGTGLVRRQVDRETNMFLETNPNTSAFACAGN